MHQRVNLFGIQIDSCTLEDAVLKLQDVLRGSERTCQFVVTPNVDHLVQLREHRALQQAYQKASWVFADGKPVVAASRLLGRGLPTVVPGSDLVPALLQTSTQQSPLRYYLLGAAPGVAERASEKIKEEWPTAQCVGFESPPLGFEKDPQANQEIIQRVNQAQPDLLVLGLGAPKQELWIAKHADALEAKLAVCAGATIDFLAGEKQRAPRWMRSLALEWFHRMASEPQRLLPRYAKDAWFFPQIVFRQWISQRRVGI